MSWIRPDRPPSRRSFSPIPSLYPSQEGDATLSTTPLASPAVTGTPSAIRVRAG